MLSQDAPSDTASRLEDMTCGAFVAFDLDGQRVVEAAMRTHVPGTALPETPLPESASVDAANGTGASHDQPADNNLPEAVEGHDDNSASAPGGAETADPEDGNHRRVVAMRMSCENIPDVRTMDGLRAAFGNNL